MTVYNKLKIAILAVIASQNIHAINIDPVQVQSAPGELLYAEIHFRNSDTSVPLNASLASAEDLHSMGTGHQPPGHLNFFTRRDGAGNGVITITSSRPVTDAELNFIVNIKEGNASRLQAIKTPLKRSTPSSNANITRSNERPLAPVIIVNEKDIALNLPVSTLYTAKPVISTETPLLLSSKMPPKLAQLPTSSTPVAIEPSAHVQNYSVAVPNQNSAANNVATPAQTQTAAVNPSQANTASKSNQMSSASVSQDPLAKKYAEEVAAKGLEKTVNQTPLSARAPESVPTAAQTTTKYVVQSNESLWGIASLIAAEQNRPVSDVMKQIKTSNEHAFIQGDVNRLRRGAALNLNGAKPSKQPEKISAAELAKAPSNQSGKTKYRLNQAEMSLVAEKAKDSTPASANSAAEKNKTSNELSLKVMTSREKTVKLQRNVTQLELALNQKDHRIQLLNARLAQLQQQLKAQQADKRSQ